jgi:hypothetical protein
MIFTYLFILSYITFPFCGNPPCVECPEHGDCSSGKLKCLKPFKPYRYECAERDSLRRDVQDYILQAEMYMLKQVFEKNSLRTTETDLFLQTEADNLTFDYFIDWVIAGHSKVLRHSKDFENRYLEVRVDYAYFVSFLLFLDSHWIFITIVLLFVVFVVLSKKVYVILSKIKLE